MQRIQNLPKFSITPPRLRALILEDLKGYPDSSSSEIMENCSGNICKDQTLTREDAVRYTGDRAEKIPVWCSGRNLKDTKPAMTEQSNDQK